MSGEHDNFTVKSGTADSWHVADASGNIVFTGALCDCERWLDDWESRRATFPRESWLERLWRRLWNRERAGER